MTYNALDTQKYIDICMAQLVLEREDLIASRAYEGALEAAEINTYVEKYGYEPYDTDEYSEWRGDKRIAALDKALEALRALNETKAF